MNLLDPFSPTSADPNASPGSQDNSGVVQQWSDALNDPTVRTTLLQAGLSLMQPPSFGQTATGAFGQAIGSAGEALGRQDEMARKQQEADTKALLRESQATSAESRAKTAGDMVGLKGAATAAQLEGIRGKLATEREKLNLTQLLQGQRRKIEASNAYTAYLKTRGPLDTEPALTQEEFYKTRGFGDILSGTGGGSASATGAGTAEPVDELAAAQEALSRGANPAAVRARYKYRTGQEMP